MYKYRKPHVSKITSVEKVEGETIEQKIERIVDNKEPITDGAPEIYTARKEGVNSAYNIRTDRWEIATDGMDKVQKSVQATRDNKAKSGDSEKGKVIELKKEKSAEPKSIEGTGTK